MNLPDTRLPALQWFEARINTWTTNATNIGLTGASMTSFANLIKDCRADYDAMQTARAAAKAATQKFYTSCTAMRDPGRGYIAAIKAYAESTGNDNVYNLGMIDPPAPPTPVPAPDVPKDLTGSVSPTGQITLTWSAVPSGPSSGIFFMVQRQRSGESGYTLLGGTQDKTFLDPVPHVTGGPVSYQVRAQRGSDYSDWTVPIVFDLSGAGFAFDASAGFVGEQGGASAQAA